MTAHLLIMYPRPKDAKDFDRAYREEHLPYAGPRLDGATGVKTRRVAGPGFAPPPYHLMSDVSFPNSRHPEGLRDLQRRPGAPLAGYDRRNGCDVAISIE